MSIFKTKLLLFFFIGLQFSGNLLAQENSLLWKISSPEIAHESYLFGTIHIICADDFKMDDRIQKAFKSTSKLVMELNMGDPKMMAEMQQASINENFSNLKNEFSEAEASKIDAFLKENYGAGLDQFGILKPFVLSSMILIRMLPCEEQKSYEMFFTGLAKEMDMLIEGLETVGFQVGMFDHIPKKLQLEEIAKMVNEEQSSEEFNQMTRAYLEEDLDKLYQQITDSEMFQEHMDILLVDRNKNWIAKIAEQIHNQPTFIAVGAGHLASETGVIALLREAGYTVEPIFQESEVLN